MSNDVPKRRRRFWQFSLRTLLVLITVFSLWLGLWVKDARRKKEALDAVLQMRGFVEYAHQFPGGKRGGGKRNDKAEPTAPAWLRKSLGDEYFVRAVGLQFAEVPIRDEDLVHVGVLTDLEYLSFLAGRGEKITCPGLAHLRNLTQLRSLDLLAHPITDDSLPLLEPLTQLEYVDLRSTRITDEGLKHLKLLKALRSVALSNNQISDAGLRYLKDLPNLKSLTLRYTKVTDEGLQDLQQALPNCRIIHRDPARSRL
jgi:hypothetical protein